jgi:excisionase family DNA binding protein
VSDVRRIEEHTGLANQQERTEFSDIGVILVTRSEAARLLSLSVREIDELRRSGQILARRHGRKVLIPVTELRRYADSLPSDEPFGRRS